MPATTTTSRADRQSREKKKLPVLGINLFDRLSSFMIALVVALVFCVLMTFTQWSATRPPVQQVLVPMELVEGGGGGGFEDGDPAEGLMLESPEDAPAEEPTEPSDILPFNADETPVEVTDSMLAQVVSVEDSMVPQLPGSDTVTPRRSFGKGGGGGGGEGGGFGAGKGLGFGTGSGGGYSRDQRWFIKFADEVSLTEYAAQIDFFGLELGALLKDGTIAYISNVSAAAPKKTIKQSGKGEERLYMTWQGGNRKAADEKLFEKAGIDAKGAILFHFYPERTEELLAQLEYQYAKRKGNEIRRTYFVVVKEGRNYNFVVTRQTYLK